MKRRAHRHSQVQNQQRDGDCEDAVAEGLGAIGLAHARQYRPEPALIGPRRTTGLSAVRRVALSSPRTRDDESWSGYCRRGISQWWLHLQDDGWLGRWRKETAASRTATLVGRSRQPWCP